VCHAEALGKVDVSTPEEPLWSFVACERFLSLLSSHETLSRLQGDGIRIEDLNYRVPFDVLHEAIVLHRAEDSLRQASFDASSDGMGCPPSSSSLSARLSEADRLVQSLLCQEREALQRYADLLRKERQRWTLYEATAEGTIHAYEAPRLIIPSYGTPEL